MRVGKNEAIYKYLSKSHPELIEDELVVLGSFIMITEKEIKKRINSSELNFLVQRKYFTEFRLRKLLQNLVHNGYLVKDGKTITYGPRTIIEFSDTARK